LPESRCFSSFSATASGLLRFLARPPDGFQVRQHELRLDRLDVTDRVERAGDVDDVAALEAPHDFHDRVHFPDVLEKFVPEPLPARRALDEPGDVDELDGRGNDLRGPPDLRQRLEPGVRDSDDADVRLDGAERVVRGLRLPGSGERVEERRLADVREADDPGAEHLGSL
jgi:hypothetical protein